MNFLTFMTNTKMLFYSFDNLRHFGRLENILKYFNNCFQINDIYFVSSFDFLQNDSAQILKSMKLQSKTMMNTILSSRKTKKSTPMKTVSCLKDIIDAKNGKATLIGKREPDEYVFTEQMKS